MAPQTPVTILVIDDEPSFVSGVAQLLRHDGMTVDTAANGRLALAHLQVQRYDVILCDLRMPEIDGRVFYTILLHQDDALRQRVIFVTGDSVRADSLAFLAQCGQPYLYKPCTIAAIRRAIAQMLHAVGSLPTLMDVSAPRGVMGAHVPSLTSPGEPMYEEGTLRIVRTASDYRVRYASNHYGTLDRPPYRCADTVHLGAFLHACGLDRWSIHQADVELRHGRIAVMPITIALAQLEVAFPLPCAADALALAPASV